MDIIVGDRQTGRTGKIIQLVKNNNGILFVFSQREIERIKSYNLEIEVYTYDKIKEFIHHGRNLYIDNLELFFNHVFGGVISGLTILGRVIDDTKFDFQSPQELRERVLQMGVDYFNQEFPHWRITKE